jgi:hypothetical protein
MVRHGSSVGAWNTKPISGPGPSRLRSPIRALPLVRLSSPPRIFSSVDLPQPLGPTRQMNSPSSISKLRSSSATSGSRPALL